jgi:hypothetical protein
MVNKAGHLLTISNPIRATYSCDHGKNALAFAFSDGILTDY